MKYKNIFLISMLVLSMIAAVVWAVDMATVQITVNLPQFNNTNMSGNFNDTFNVSFSSVANITNATFIFHTGGTHLTGTRLCNFTIYNTSTDITSLQNTSINASLATLTACTDGYYNVSIQAFNNTVNADAFASLNNSIINLTLDRTAPVADFAGPNVSTPGEGDHLANLSTGATVYNVTVKDATLGVYALTLDIGASFVGGVFNSTFNDTQGGLNWWVVQINSSIMSEDDYDTVTINTRDRENNTNSTQILEIRVDRTVPYTVNLSSVSFNTTDTTFNVSLIAMDNIYKNVTCRLQVNNQSYNTSNILNGTNTFLTVSTALNNNNTWAVSANCTDGSGNVNTTFNTPYNATSNTWINVTVDNLAPSVGFNTNTTVINAFNVSTSAATVNLTAILSDATLGVYIVRFNVTNLTSGVLQFNSSASVSGGELGAWNVTIDPTQLGEGEIIVRAVANDTNNNQNNSETLILRVDRTIPNTKMNSTSFNTTDTTPNVTFGIKDNVYLNISCTLYQNNQSDNTTRFTNASDANLTINSSLGQTNTLFLYVNCTDGSGNRNTTSSSLDGINVTIDSVSPRVGFNSNTTVVNAINVSTSATFVNVSVAVSDAILGVHVVRLNVTNASATLQYNASLLSGSGGQESSWNASINITDLGDGEHTITAVTNDTNNNANNSETLIVRVDRAVPYAVVINTTAFNTTDTSPNVTVTFKDAVYKNATCNLYANNVSYNASNINNGTIGGTSINLTVNATGLADGSYFFSLNCTDGSGNRNTTVTNESAGVNVTIDTTLPLVSAFNRPAATFQSSDFLLNVTINESGSKNARYVQFRLENGTNAGQIITNYTNGNLTLNGSNYWTVLLGIDLVADWNYTLRINATDQLGNSNTTQTLTVAFDNSAPVISSFTCADIGTGDAQSCTCTATDNSASFGGGVTTSIGSVDTGASGTKTVGCTATDTAGNSRSDSTTFTVSSSGGGGGGSGGGSSSGVRDQFEKKVWTSINAGETATMTVENGVIGVSEVSFTVSDTTYGAWVQVRKASTLPSSVADFGRKAYSTLEFTQLNVADKLQGDATVKFKVDKSWLTSNEIKKGEVALFRYVEGAWTKLATTVGEDDGTYIHYTATTPGFSYFIIGQTAEPSAVAEEPAAEEAGVPPAVTGGEVTPPVAEEAPVEEAPVEESAAQGSMLWVVPVLAVIILAGVLYWYWKRR